MKRQALKIFAVLTLFVMAGATLAYSQPTPILRVDIPFNFVVGEDILPAGEYTVERPSNNNQALLLMRNTLRGGVLYTATILIGGRDRQEKSKLVFHRYGDNYFLAQVWKANEEVGRQVGPSRIERRLALKHGPTSVAMRPETVIIFARTSRAGGSESGAGQ
jgi:hypothetical protein